MIVKMLCTFEFDPATNTYTPVGNPEIVKQTQSKPKVNDESSEPQLILAENKYSLNSAAIDLLGVNVGDRIDIKYQIIDDINIPIIGSSTVWNSNSGNKLTKSGTVSYRGTANVALSEYGSLFTLTPWKGHDGLFILMGDEPLPQKEETIEDDNVEIPVDDEIEDDIKDKEDELSLDDLEDDSNTELSNFKFKF